jgi:hypothetical protein
MRIRKVVHKPVKLNREGINLVGGIDAAINANIQGGPGSKSSATSKQVTRIVQGGGKSRTYTGDDKKEVQE